MNNNFYTDIILPNYNKKDYIDETIQSVINQTFKNWNLIIIDNNSNDGSDDILKKYYKFENIKIIKLRRNMGLSFSRNLGLRLAKNKYVSFLDSDDLWDKNKLKKQISFMKQNDYSFIYTNYTPFYTHNGFKTFKKTIYPKEKYNLNIFIEDTSIATSSMIIKKELINSSKFKKKSHNEDYDFKCKILKKGINAYNLNENLTFYRITKNSRSSYKLKSLISIFNTNKNLLNLSLFKNLKAILSISINSIKKYGFK